MNWGVVLRGLSRWLTVGTSPDKYFALTLFLMTAIMLIILLISNVQ